MSEKISEWKTTEDWKEDRKKLVVGQDISAWKQAYNNYFFSRLNTRYLEPIQTIQQNSFLQGEGFSIVAIQCSLREAEILVYPDADVGAMVRNHLPRSGSRERRCSRRAMAS